MNNIESNENTNKYEEIKQPQNEPPIEIQKENTGDQQIEVDNNGNQEQQNEQKEMQDKIQNNNNKFKPTNNTIEEEEAEADVDDKDEIQVSISEQMHSKKIKYFKEKRQQNINGYSSSGRDEQWSSHHHHSLIQCNQKLTSSDEEKFHTVNKNNSIRNKSRNTIQQNLGRFELKATAENEIEKENDHVVEVIQQPLSEESAHSSSQDKLSTSEKHDTRDCTQDQVRLQYQANFFQSLQTDNLEIKPRSYDGNKSFVSGSDIQEMLNQTDYRIKENQIHKLKKQNEDKDQQFYHSINILNELTITKDIKFQFQNTTIKSNVNSQSRFVINEINNEDFVLQHTQGAPSCFNDDNQKIDLGDQGGTNHRLSPEDIENIQTKLGAEQKNRNDQIEIDANGKAESSGYEFMKSVSSPLLQNDDQKNQNQDFYLLEKSKLRNKRDFKEFAFDLISPQIGTSPEISKIEENNQQECTNENKIQNEIHSPIKDSKKNYDKNQELHQVDEESDQNENNHEQIEEEQEEAVEDEQVEGQEAELKKSKSFPIPAKDLKLIKNQRHSDGTGYFTIQPENENGYENLDPKKTRKENGQAKEFKNRKEDKSSSQPKENNQRLLDASQKSLKNVLSVHSAQNQKTKNMLEQPEEENNEQQDIESNYIVDSAISQQQQDEEMNQEAQNIENADHLQGRPRALTQNEVIGSRFSGAETQKQINQNDDHDENDENLENLENDENDENDENQNEENDENEIQQNFREFTVHATNVIQSSNGDNFAQEKVDSNSEINSENKSGKQKIDDNLIQAGEQDIEIDQSEDKFQIENIDLFQNQQKMSQDLRKSVISKKSKKKLKKELGSQSQSGSGNEELEETKMVESQQQNIKINQFKKTSSQYQNETISNVQIINDVNTIPNEIQDQENLKSQQEKPKSVELNEQLDKSQNSTINQKIQENQPKFELKQASKIIQSEHQSQKSSVKGTILQSIVINQQQEINETNAEQDGQSDKPKMNIHEINEINFQDKLTSNIIKQDSQFKQKNNQIEESNNQIQAQQSPTKQQNSAQFQTEMSASPLFGVQGSSLTHPLQVTNFIKHTSQNNLLPHREINEQDLKKNVYIIDEKNGQIEEEKAIIKILDKNNEISQTAQRDTYETQYDGIQSLQNDTRNSRFTFIKINEEKKQEQKSQRNMLGRKSNSVGNIFFQNPQFGMHNGQNIVYQQNTAPAMMNRLQNQIGSEIPYGTAQNISQNQQKYGETFPNYFRRGMSDQQHIQNQFGMQATQQMSPYPFSTFESIPMLNEQPTAKFGQEMDMMQHQSQNLLPLSRNHNNFHLPTSAIGASSQMMNQYVNQQNMMIEQMMAEREVQFYKEKCMIQQHQMKFQQLNMQLMQAQYDQQHLINMQLQYHQMGHQQPNNQMTMQQNYNQYQIQGYQNHLAVQQQNQLIHEQQNQITDLKNQIHQLKQQIEQIQQISQQQQTYGQIGMQRQISQELNQNQFNQDINHQNNNPYSPNFSRMSQSTPIGNENNIAYFDTHRNQNSGGLQIPNMLSPIEPVRHNNHATFGSPQHMDYQRSGDEVSQKGTINKDQNSLSQHQINMMYYNHLLQQQNQQNIPVHENKTQIGNNQNSQVPIQIQQVKNQDRNPQQNQKIVNNGMNRMN